MNDIDMTLAQAEELVAQGRVVSSTWMKLRAHCASRDLKKMVRVCRPDFCSQELWCAVVAGYLVTTLPNMTGRYLEAQS